MEIRDGKKVGNPKIGTKSFPCSFCGRNFFQHHNPISVSTPHSTSPPSLFMPGDHPIVTRTVHPLNITADADAHVVAPAVPTAAAAFRDQWRAAAATRATSSGGARCEGRSISTKVETRSLPVPAASSLKQPHTLQKKVSSPHKEQRQWQKLSTQRTGRSWATPTL